MTKGHHKRSVTIAGHRTSFSLEQPFWEELQGWAREEDLSLNQLVAQIDRSRTGKAEGVNLSSALRLAILARLKSKLAAATSFSDS